MPVASSPGLRSAVRAAERLGRSLVWVGPAAIAALAVSGCGLRPFGVEAAFGVIPEAASIARAEAVPLERERAALGGGSAITEAQLAILRQRALALCPLLPPSVQVRCLVSQL
ncbi:MAG: hypothetical protein [Microviridae sp.]|nr:MAG: hypothetical protein [Microviridae sp.]